MVARIGLVLHHGRGPVDNRHVYAMMSRRAGGLSIGIDLNQDAACNFDCVYCQVDRTHPRRPAEPDVQKLAAELDELLARAEAGDLWTRAPFDGVPEDHRHVADIAFAGHGEPTLAPELDRAAQAARAVRDRRRLAVPLRLLTNATLFHREWVRGALGWFDELWCKLDAGTVDGFRRTNRTAVPLARVLQNLVDVARRRPIVVQSLFAAVGGAGPDAAEIDAYAARLADIVSAGGAIDRVQVYTLCRPPADPRVAPLPVAALEEIAARVRRLGLRAEVYGASAGQRPGTVTGSVASC